MFPPLAACAQANAGRLRRLRRGDEELKQKKIPAGTMLGSSSQKMSCANGCGMTWGKGANQCDDLNTRHIAPRCCKCVKQLIPGWNFDEWACVACMNRQREQQTPQAPPASATAASAGAASNEAARLIQRREQEEQRAREAHERQQREQQRREQEERERRAREAVR